MLVNDGCQEDPVMMEERRDAKHVLCRLVCVCDDREREN